MPERLQVIYGEVSIATLDRGDDGRLEMAYSKRAIRDADGEPLLSVSLPVRAEPYSQEHLLPFFDGLLPEEDVRRRIAQRLQVDAGDVFGLLRELGRDCAGAFSIVPDGYDLAAALEEGVDWLTDEQLAERVRELDMRPLAVEPARDIRISLAGAQAKMAVVWDGDRIGLPRGITPSTHILKPASTAERAGRKRRLAYPALVANEGFCMTLAHLAGLSVAEVRVIRIAGEPAVLIKRYDRTHLADGVVIRVHQEDFAQALGIPSYRKYEKEGGPGISDYLELLRRNSASTIEDLEELIDRVAFNYAVGNADAHAKNFSLLHGNEGMRLAPGYDLLSTYAYDELSHDMATSIGGIFDARGVKPVHWRKELARLALDPGLYSQRLAELADRLENHLTEALEWADKIGLADTRLVRIADLVRKRAQILRGARDVPDRSDREDGRQAERRHSSRG